VRIIDENEFLRQTKTGSPPRPLNPGGPI
jgi:hypothetical protein